MIKVSIVVPVYKVEKYLHSCIDSLINQSLTDIEIILVDDGSPDRCGMICDEYAAADSRVKVIHQENRGQAAARNAGIRAATGTFIGFVDSDDHVEPDMYEKMYAAGMKYNCDFILCSYRKEGETCEYKDFGIGGGFYDKNRIQNEIFPQLIMRECVDFGPLISLCSCIYRSDFLKKHNLALDERLRVSEDCLFCSCTGLYADSFYYLKDEYPYHYRYNAASISHSVNPRAWPSFLLMNEVFEELITGHSYDFSRQIRLHMLYFTLNMLQRVAKCDIPSSQKKAVFHEILTNPRVLYAMKGFRIPKVNLRFRTIIFLIKHRLSRLLYFIYCH